MRKYKLFYITILLSICVATAGCNSLLEKKKPYVFYYTNLLAKNITKQSDYLCIILDTNFYKEQTLSKEDEETIKNFIQSLHKNNYISKPKDLPAKPMYKIFLTFKSEKYVIDVFNIQYISIYPWDGDYAKDYIDMSTIPAAYNIFSLCKYVIPR